MEELSISIRLSFLSVPKIRRYLELFFPAGTKALLDSSLDFRR
jgi:hypothetical protein